MNNSVIETLKAVGLYKTPVLQPDGTYKPAGRMAEQTLKTTLPDGQVTEHSMAEIDYSDLVTLADELDIMLEQENPWIQALFAKNAVAIANAVRVVNVDSASGFKGAVGSGRQLDILRFRPEQFQDPAVAAVAQARLTWARAMGLVVPPVGYTGEIICAPAVAGDVVDTHGALTMGTTEALRYSASPIPPGHHAPAPSRLRIWPGSITSRTPASTLPRYGNTSRCLS